VEAGRGREEREREGGKMQREDAMRNREREGEREREKERERDRERARSNEAETPSENDLERAMRTRTCASSHKLQPVFSYTVGEKELKASRRDSKCGEQPDSRQIRQHCREHVDGQE